jgi:arsenate reductase (thioredoxin)
MEPAVRSDDQASRRRPADPLPRVLFLCSGNSCRSQMAEGWARALLAGFCTPLSAGTTPTSLNPLAVRAMAEVGIDISGHRSKRPEELGTPVDIVVTVCGAAREVCPVLPLDEARVVHAPFDDPPRLAAEAEDDEAAMMHYRRVRDEIGTFVRTLPDLISRLSDHRKPQEYQP